MTGPPFFVCEGASAPSSSVRFKSFGLEHLRARGRACDAFGVVAAQPLETWQGDEKGGPLRGRLLVSIISPERSRSDRKGDRPPAGAPLRQQREQR